MMFLLNLAREDYRPQGRGFGGVLRFLSFAIVAVAAVFFLSAGDQADAACVPGVFCTATGGEVLALPNTTYPETTYTNPFGAVLLSNGPGSSITANGLTITCERFNGCGGVAEFGGFVSLTGSTIITSDFASFGVYASFGDSRVVVSDTTILTAGDSAWGAEAIDGSIDLSNTTIKTTGTGAYGLYANTDGVITSRGMLIDTAGALSHAAAAISGTLVIDDSIIGTSGDTAAGLYSTGSLTADGVEVETTGSGAPGAQAESGGQLTVINSSLSASGIASHGVQLSDGTVTIVGSSVIVNGSGAHAISGGPLGASSVTASNSVFSSAQGVGITTAGSNLEVNLTGSSIGGGAGLAATLGGGILNIEAHDGSNLAGQVTTEVGSQTSITLEDSAWTLTGTSNVTALVNNSSRVEFGPHVGNPLSPATYKTLTANTYVGSDGNVVLNSYLGTDGSPSDMIVIDGGSATGASGLAVNNVSGPGALTLGNGILVVDTINGGITDPAAFRLAAPAVAGPYEYSLYRSSVDGSAPQSWYLRSSLVPVPPGPGPDPTPDYRPEVSLYASIPSMGAIYGRHLIDNLHERVGEEEQLKGRSGVGGDDTFNGYWIRGLGHWGHRDGDANGIYSGAPEYDYRFGAIQGGIDFYRREKDGIADHAGMYLAYGHGRVDVTQNRLIETRDAGHNDFNAYSVGGYWTRFGESGWYIDGVLQSTWYDVTTTSNHATEIGFPDQDVDGFGFAASLESGYPFNLGNGWQVEPQGQLVWQTINFDDFNDGAADIRYDNLNSTAGRVGTRVARTWELEEATASAPARLATVWGRINLWHEFTAKAQTDISSASGFVPFSYNLDETWIEFGIGGTRQISQNTSLYGNVNFSTTFDGDNYAWTGKVGVRVNW